MVNQCGNSFTAKNAVLLSGQLILIGDYSIFHSSDYRHYCKHICRHIINTIYRTQEIFGRGKIGEFYAISQNFPYQDL